MNRATAFLMIGVLWVSCGLGTSAQDVPNGRFLTDTIRLGEEVEYILTYSHPPAQEILFPDSTHDFSPFEYVSHRYFSTRTRGQMSLDSAVYTLMLFELDSAPSLSLPVTEIEKDGKSSNKIYSLKDHVHLKEVITYMPDTLALKENTTMAKVKRQFNYPYLIVGLLGLGLLALLFTLVFGKSVKRGFVLRRMKRQHKKFMESFDKYAKNADQPSEIEKALVLWKNYAGKLRGQSLVSYTTKEIRQIIPNETLATALGQIDRAIYASRIDGEVGQSLIGLKDFAQLAYQEKMKEVKHG